MPERPGRASRSAAHAQPAGPRASHMTGRLGTSQGRPYSPLVAHASAVCCQAFPCLRRHAYLGAH
eukprot:800357-Alexandrium_andersonii.AAC.1